jgi:hypothetical protein
MVLLWNVVLALHRLLQNPQGTQTHIVRVWQPGAVARAAPQHLPLNPKGSLHPKGGQAGTGAMGAAYSLTFSATCAQAVHCPAAARHSDPHYPPQPPAPGQHNASVKVPQSKP